MEFKAGFRNREWPEVVKDIVAMANSGGGTIVFGVLDSGRTSHADLDEVAAVDPAQLADQIQRYTAPAVVFAVDSADFPLIFEREGAAPPMPWKPSLNAKRSSGLPRACRRVNAI